MPAHVIFDVEIRDMNQYQEFMKGVKPAIEAAGGKYLARGGRHKVYEGDWEPRRIVLFEFPDIAAFEAFYNGQTYRERGPSGTLAAPPAWCRSKACPPRQRAVLPDVSSPASLTRRPAFGEPIA